MFLKVVPCVKSPHGGSVYVPHTRTIYLCPDEVFDGKRPSRPLLGLTLAHEIGHAVLQHSRATWANCLRVETEAHVWEIQRRGKVTPTEARFILGTLPLGDRGHTAWGCASPEDRSRATRLVTALRACVRLGRTIYVGGSA